MHWIYTERKIQMEYIEEEVSLEIEWRKDGRDSKTWANFGLFYCNDVFLSCKIYEHMMQIC